MTAYTIIGILWVIVVFYICKIVFKILRKILKIPKNIEDKKSRRINTIGSACVAMLILVYIFLTPIYFEFPRLFSILTTAATFNEDGEPIYNKWGLYTPPGREVAEIPIGWKSTIDTVLFDECSKIYLEYNNEFYRMLIKEKWMMSGPIKFYRKPERRKQLGWTLDIDKTTGDPIQEVNNPIAPGAIVNKTIIKFHFKNNKKIIKICQEIGIPNSAIYKNKNSGDTKVIKAITLFIEESINKKLKPEGIIIKAEVYINKIKI